MTCVNLLDKNNIFQSLHSENQHFETSLSKINISRGWCGMSIVFGSN